MVFRFEFRLIFVTPDPDKFVLRPIHPGANDGHADFFVQADDVLFEVLEKIIHLAFIDRINANLGYILLHLSGETASLSRRTHPSHCFIDDIRHRRFRIWRNAADVDFAKNIAIFAVVFLRTEQEIAISENRKILGFNPQQSLHFWHPLMLKVAFEGLEFRHRRRMV